MCENKMKTLQWINRRDVIISGLKILESFKIIEQNIFYKMRKIIYIEISDVFTMWIMCSEEKTLRNLKSQLR